MNPAADSKSRHASTMEAALNSQIQLLRSRVEADLGKPAVVMVTSALPGDGKTLTAQSLALGFGKSGHRVAVAGLSAAGLDQREIAVVSLPPEDGRVTERERLVAFIESSRAAYDYTVIDAGTFLRSNTAMALAPLVDGILLTVRVGRAPSDDDELLVRTIEHSRGRIVGVVAIDEKAISEFERAQSPERMGLSGAATPSRPQAPTSVFAGGRVVEGKA